MLCGIAFLGFRDGVSGNNSNSETLDSFERHGKLSEKLPSTACVRTLSNLKVPTDVPALPAERTERAEWRPRDVTSQERVSSTSFYFVLYFYVSPRREKR